MAELIIVEAKIVEPLSIRHKWQRDTSVLQIVKDALTKALIDNTELEEKELGKVVINTVESNRDGISVSYGSSRYYGVHSKIRIIIEV